MNRVNWSVLVSFIVLVFTGHDAWCQQQDFVFQPGFMLEKKLSRSFALRLYTQAFQNQDLGETSSAFGELGIQYRITNRYSLQAGFRQGIYRNLDNAYDDRQLLSIAFNYAYSKKGFTYSFRGRFQRLYFGDFDRDNYRNPRSYFRYRFTVRKRINYYYSPFVEYETFQPLNLPTRQGLDQHRWSAGLSYTVNDGLRFEGYYQLMWLTNRSNPKTNYVIGLNTFIRL